MTQEVFVVAYEGDDDSGTLLEYAIERARKEDAALHIVHVLEWSPYSFLTPQEVEERHSRRKEELARAKAVIIDPAVVKASDAGLSATGEIRYGQVVELIAEIARQKSAAMISSGARDRTRSPPGSSARCPWAWPRSPPFPPSSCPEESPHEPRNDICRRAGGLPFRHVARRAQGIDETINSIFADYTGWYVGLIFADLPGTNFSWIALWLVVGALIFTFYFGFIQLKGFGHSIRLVKGDYSDPNDAGEVSHFQALATALSGTVGLGNIAGVAVAVGIGGPGATFWMVIAGLFGMATKFTECTLGVKYRNEYEDGHVSGGPMYYITKGFKERGLPGGKILAVLFCIFTILGALGGGNMFQANQAHAQLSNVIGDYPGWITGVILAGITFVVIVGGIKSIARVTEKVVPFMGIFYVVVSLIILFMNYDMILWAFGQIFQGAFTGLGVAGGFTGALIQGFRRAAFSNEAGIGSAPSRTRR